MVGADHHNGLYYFNAWMGVGVPPGPPVPIPPGLMPVPPSYHFVLTMSAWPAGEKKINSTVFVEGDPIVSKGHESAKNLHVPPGGNLLFPVTWIFTSSKWMFGVGTVQAKEGAVACTLGGPIGITYNCQDPCALPAPNLMRATASVHVQPSGADWLGASIDMLLCSIVELVTSAVLQYGPGLAKRLVGKQISAMLKRLFERLGGALGRGNPLVWVGKAIEMEGRALARLVEKLGGKGYMGKAAERTVEKEFNDSAKKAADKATKKEIEEYARAEGAVSAKEAEEKARAARGKAAEEKAEELYKKHFDQSASEVGQETTKGAVGDPAKDAATSKTEDRRRGLADKATRGPKGR
jgi:hypothetical protein